MEPTKAYNDHNVYILGAGFSVEAGLPVIKNFMNRMRDAAAWLQDQEDRGKEVKAIERMLDFRLKAAAAAYRVPLNVENIEELFSLASASGPPGLSDDVTTAIAATLDFCAQTAAHGPELNPIYVSRIGGSEWAMPKNWELHNTQVFPNSKVYKCPRYEFYLGLMCGYFSEANSDRRDTIISFNYDTVIEEALSALGLPFRYAAPEMVEWRAPFDSPLNQLEVAPEAIPVLKLHGSVNLAVKRSKDMGDHPLGYRTYAELRAGGHTPLLVAPTWQKSLGGYLSEFWSEAVSALKTATRVVIIGYSVPQTDQHFRYLLAAGLQQNISLRKIVFVNNADQKEFKQHLHDVNLFRDEHFEHGIVEVQSRTIDDFLHRARGLTGTDGPNLIGRTPKEDTWWLA